MKVLNLENKRFGAWLVISDAPAPSGARGTPHWLCECDCGVQRLISATNLSFGASKSCGCKKAINRQVKTLDDIFNCSFPEPNSGCWIWMGKTNDFRSGYGYASTPSGRTGAHRLALSLATGRNPPLYACHKCDVPSCVNPDHLFWGTPSDNSKDCYSKGRSRIPVRRGEEAARAKLNNADVALIRADKRPHKVIAKDFSVSRAAISAVKSFKTFKEDLT